MDNPQHYKDQKADEHDNTSYYVLLARGSQVFVVGLVILDSSQSLFCEGRWIAALTQVPRFLAVAPGADLGRGNEAIIAAHEKSVKASPPRVNNPPVHRSSRGVRATKSSDCVRA